ncbi:ETX/MTX2 family pore-forming toxin [Bacillus thuringiensis]|uniref:ETX/MTX2 family pore-forming toxin n=1 Tax=Bacillus thuringiensis TaxID=1428 RepID=UPI003CFDFFE7
MKNKKNIKRKIATTSSIITLATSFAFTLPELAKADSKNSVNKSQQYMGYAEDPIVVVPVEEDVGLRSLITDNNQNTFYDAVRKIIGWNGISSLSANFLHYQQPTHSVELSTPVKDEIASPILLGKSTLHNSLGTTQKLSSAAMSKSVASTVTATVTHGAKVGAKIGAKFKVPLVAEANAELNTEYSFADTGTKTSTETVTYTIPSQSIELKPNEKAIVSANLRMMQTSGDVILRTKYNGKVHITGQTSVVPSKIDQELQLGPFVNSLISEDGNIGEYWHASLEEHNIVYQDGKGKFTAEYGTIADIKVEIYDDTDRSDSIDNKKPIKSYTYTVTPEVSKNI